MGAVSGEGEQQGEEQGDARPLPPTTPWPSLPSSLLRLAIEGVYGSTRPAGMYKRTDTARACARVCRAWRDGVRAEAPALRWLASRDGPLSKGTLDRLSALSTVEIDGEEEEGDGGDDKDGDEGDCASRSDRAWRQARELAVRRAPRLLRRVLQRASFDSLHKLEAFDLPRAALADLGRCLTRDRLPALGCLVLDALDGGAALDWPFGDDDKDGGAADGEGGGGGGGGQNGGGGGGGQTGGRHPPPRPPPLWKLTVQSRRNPPPLGPPRPPAQGPEEDAALPLGAAATVTPRLLRALAPTLKDLTIDAFPAAGAAVLVAGGEGEEGEGARQLVPLEALLPLLGVPGLALRALALHGDIEWEAPDPNAPATSAPAPGAAAAALAAALAAAAQAGGPGAPPPPPPPAADFVDRFEASAARFYAAGRFAYARRRAAADFAAVIAALAPSLERLEVVRGNGRWRAPAALPPTLPSVARPAEWPAETRRVLGPAPGLEPRGRARRWLPECLAGLERLTHLTADGAFDSLRAPPRGPLPISDATTGRLPPRLRQLALRASRGGGRQKSSERVGVAFEGGVDALSELEVLELDFAPRRPSGLPRCLLDGRMPRLEELRLGEEAARADPALLSALALRGRVRVSVGGDAYEDWAGRRAHEEGWHSGDGDYDVDSDPLDESD